MRKWLCVPMMVLLLTGCGAEGTKELAASDLRQYYQDMTGCTMEATISCDQEGLAWEGTLRCDYVPSGESTVEVLSPELLTGVKAIVTEEDWSLSYEGETLNIAPLTEESLSPATCLPRLMNALRDGWLLEENRETWGEKECIRLMVDQSGTGERKIISTLWLALADGAPVHGEVAVDEEVIFTVEFTAFSFCDIMNVQEAATSGR